MGTAFFSLSVLSILGFLVPLWALSLHATPVQIGILVALAAFMPFILAIPMGALADRVGSPRLIVVGGLGTAVAVALYPVLPSIGAAMTLQLVVGLFQALAWQSAQTYVTTFGKDATRASVVGWFGATATLGSFAGPILIGSLAAVGWNWAFWGVAGWALCIVVFGRGLQSPKSVSGMPARGFFEGRPQDFSRAFGLLRHPLVLFVMLGTFIRLAVTSVRQSFYPVYLHAIAIPVAPIGWLVAVNALIGALASALVGPLSRRLSLRFILLGGLIIGIAAQSLVVFTDNFVVLVLLSALSGFGLGATLPALITLLSEATAASDRGLAVGLRNTANSIGILTVPVGLGMMVSADGLRIAFVILGVGLLLCVALLYRYQGRLAWHPRSVGGSGRP